MMLKANAEPFISFAEGLERSLKISDRSLDLGNLPFELVRFEVDDRSATAGELTVTFYPSDALVGLGAAL